MAKHRVLVTGAFGFIGSRFVELAEMTGAYDLHIMPQAIDLRNYEMIQKYCFDKGNFQYLLHFADKNPTSEIARRSPHQNMQDNLAIAANALRIWEELFSEATFVGFDSVWAYPEGLTEITETDYWNGAMPSISSHYGIVKKLLHVGIDTLARQKGMRGKMFLLGNVYGPGDQSSRLIPTVLRKMIDQTDVLLMTSGNEKRDFIYLDDQIQGILVNLDADVRILNVSSGVYHSVRQVVEEIASQLRFRGNVEYSGGEGRGVTRTIDMSRAMSITGWPSSHDLLSLKAGLRKTITLDLKQK